MEVESRKGSDLQAHAFPRVRIDWKANAEALPVAAVSARVWLKVKELGVHGCESLVPFTKVPFW